MVLTGITEAEILNVVPKYKQIQLFYSPYKLKIMKKKFLYEAINSDIVRYYYLCMHPNNPEYYILMNATTETPERFYIDRFKRLFEDEEAAAKFIYAKLIEEANFIKKQYNFQ